MFQKRKEKNGRMEQKGAYKNLQDHVLKEKRKKCENGTIGGIQRETGQSGGWLLRLVPGRDCNQENDNGQTIIG